jgi:Na+/melibiose symporter-like transporter
MERQYNINYAIMSLIFVGQAAGFIVSAFFNNTLLGNFGRAKTLIAAEALLLIAYIIMLCTPPYGAVIVAYVYPSCINSAVLHLSDSFSWATAW